MPKRNAKSDHMQSKSLTGISRVMEERTENVSGCCRASQTVESRLGAPCGAPHFLMFCTFFCFCLIFADVFFFKKNFGHCLFYFFLQHDLCFFFKFGCRRQHVARGANRRECEDADGAGGWGQQSVLCCSHIWLRSRDDEMVSWSLPKCIR